MSIWLSKYGQFGACNEIVGSIRQPFNIGMHRTHCTLGVPSGFIPCLTPGKEGVICRPAIAWSPIQCKRQSEVLLHHEKYSANLQNRSQYHLSHGALGSGKFIQSHFDPRPRGFDIHQPPTLGHIERRASLASPIKSREGYRGVKGQALTRATPQSATSAATTVAAAKRRRAASATRTEGQPRAKRALLFAEPDAAARRPAAAPSYADQLMAGMAPAPAGRASSSSETATPSELVQRSPAGDGTGVPCRGPGVVGSPAAIGDAARAGRVPPCAPGRSSAIEIARLVD